MKQLFRCEYCTEMGTEEEITKHEAECIHNYNKRSCLTCKHAEMKGISCYQCRTGKEIPEGKLFEFCGAWMWDEKDHTTRAFNNLFGGLFR